jgi:hypothetical protein
MPWKPRSEFSSWWKRFRSSFAASARFEASGSVCHARCASTEHDVMTRAKRLKVPWHGYEPGVREDADSTRPRANAHSLP